MTHLSHQNREKITELNKGIVRKLIEYFQRKNYD